MRQITIYTDDRPGVVAEVTAALAGSGVNIESLDAEAAESGGVVVLTVDRYDVALVALRDAGFHAVSEDALVVRIVDEPGALARLAERFRGAGINLRNVRILRRRGGEGLVALSCERTEEALRLVEDVLVS